ncbi:MAG: cytidyltransferase, partial [Methanobrevibacter sp.]|nr:cytidyltransferase [Methanobrevibacter sp.]
DLIAKGKEIAEKKDSELVIYLNKGYSANHGPFFTPYEARAEMAIAAGADKVVPIEGLHHRLTLAYSVPIRIAMMIEDGVTDYIDAANVSTEKIQQYSEKFVKQGIFVGIPRNLPNRNVIRWFAVNEFLYKKYKRNMKFHIIPELQSIEEASEKVSGRYIRRAILENDMKIPEDVKKLLPKSTTKILEREIKKGTIPKERNWTDINKKLNTYSRPNLMKIAYLNGKVINEIIKGRVYRDEESIWATFRRGGYGPVLTRLAISAIEEEVTREEVLKLMRNYEKQGVIPPEQSIDKVIERAWYVAKENQRGISAKEANDKFKSQNIKTQKIAINDVPLVLEAGLNITKFEAKKINEGLEAMLYIDKDNKISCELKKDKFKIKTNLKLPADKVTYLKYILDSHFIPITAKTIKTKRGFRIRISIHNN